MEMLSDHPETSCSVITENNITDMETIPTEKLVSINLPFTTENTYHITELGLKPTDHTIIQTYLLDVKKTSCYSK